VKELHLFFITPWSTFEFFFLLWIKSFARLATAMYIFAAQKEGFGVWETMDCWIVWL
jgi:hypothetical protein